MFASKSEGLETIPEGLFEEDVGDKTPEARVEETVGNVISEAPGLVPPGKEDQKAVTLKLGCFARQEESSEKSKDDQTSNLERQVTYATLDRTDLEACFAKALETKLEVFEISLDIQPRDVHKTHAYGKPTWTLNEKPKRRAEVQFRSLNDGDKLDFLRAMQGELSSYLEHEAVAIAKRHNVSPERVMGMRWVLTWKAVTAPEGRVTGQKPKARLIIKGYQDPDLLHLKRDAPTLVTQSRNMILSIASANKWERFLGDIKTAFLNGDQTEAQREVYAEPPEEVRQMLNMKPNELLGSSESCVWTVACTSSLGRQAGLRTQEPRVEAVED